MSTLTKVFVVLNSILSIVVSCLFVAFAAQQSNWRELAQRYQEARDSAITHTQSVVGSSLAAQALKDDDLAARGREVAEKQAQIQALTGEMAKANTELSQVKNDKLAAEAGRTKLQEILDVTSAELRTVQKQRDELLGGNQDLQSRNARLNARVLDLTAQTAILTDESRNLQEKLSAGSTGTTSRTTGSRTWSSADMPSGVSTARPAVVGQIRGQVTTIDGSYASIDVGDSSGVSSGMRFIVHRGGTYLGEIVVDRVNPKDAGGKLVALASGTISKGDSVVWGLEN